MRVRTAIAIGILLGAAISIPGCTPEQWATAQSAGAQVNDQLQGTAVPATTEDGLDAAANAIGTIGPMAAPLTGPAAPWVAVGASIVSSILGAIAADRRRRRQLQTVVRTVDAAKVEEDGVVYLDLPRLGELQDAAGVRAVVRDVRR